LSKKVTSWRKISLKMPLIKQNPTNRNTIEVANNSFQKSETNVLIYGETLYSRSVSKKTVKDIFEDLKSWVPASLLPSLDQKWFILKLKATINLLLKGQRWNFLLVQAPMLIQKDVFKYELPQNFMHHSALWATYQSVASGKMVKVELVYQDQSIVFENGENFYKVSNGGIELINLNLELQEACCYRGQKNQINTLWLSYYVKPELPKTLEQEIKWFPEVEEFDEVLRELMTYELYLRAGQRPLSMPDVNRYLQLLQLWDKQGFDVYNKRQANSQVFDFSNLIEY
jgi:hypothetical protein